MPPFSSSSGEPGSRNPPTAYEMKVHLFGATSSPDVCCLALQQAPRDSGQHSEGLLYEVVINFNVENLLSSYESKELVVCSATLLTDALKRGEFNLTLFAASHPDILVAIDKRPDRNFDINMSLNEQLARCRAQNNPKITLISAARQLYPHSRQRQGSRHLDSTARSNEISDKYL